MAEDKTTTEPEAKYKEAPEEFVASVRHDALRAALKCLHGICPAGNDIDPDDVKRLVVTAARAAQTVVDEAHDRVPREWFFHIDIEWIVATAFWCAFEDLDEDALEDVDPESKAGGVLLGFGEACVYLEVASHLSDIGDKEFEMNFSTGSRLRLPTD